MIELSARQLEVLQLVAAGITYADIARRLLTNKRAVTYAVGQVQRKLGARNTPHAIALAYQAGILADGYDPELAALDRLARDYGYRITLVPTTPGAGQ